MSLIQAGNTWKQLPTCRVVATSNQTGAYFNGTTNNGVGATFTYPSATPLVIDSVTLNINDLVLFVGQTLGYSNGVWQLVSLATPTSGAVLQRPGYYQTLEQIITGQFVMISAGSINSGQIYTLVEPYPSGLGVPLTSGANNINFDNPVSDSAAFTPTAVIFAGASGQLTGDATYFNWNDTTHTLVATNVTTAVLSATTSATTPSLSVTTSATIAALTVTGAAGVNSLTVTTTGYITTSLAVGTASTIYSGSLLSITGPQSNGIAITTYSGGAQSPLPDLFYRSSRGTSGSPTAVQNFDSLGAIYAAGYDSSAFGTSSTSATIQFNARANFTTGNHYTSIDFGVVPSGGTNFAYVLSVDNQDIIPLRANAAVATNATTGFMMLTSCAGNPSGTPSAAAVSAGACPIIINTTTPSLWIYISGTGWKTVSLG